MRKDTLKQQEAKIKSRIKKLEETNKKLDRKMEDNEKKIQKYNDKLGELEMKRMEGK